jgi:hypothetical protein
LGARTKKVLLGVVAVLVVAGVWMFWPESADVDGIAPPDGTYDAVIRRCRG